MQESARLTSIARPRRRSARWLVAALAGGALLASVAMAQTSPKIVAKDQLLRIQIYPGTILNLPIWVAAEGGFCQAHGLRCEPTAIPSGPLALQALAAGSLEIMYASTEVITAAASRGNDVQVFVGHSPNNIYTLNVSNKVPLPNLSAGYPAVMKDLKGMRIGVTARGAGTELLTRALLLGAGMTPDDVTFVATGSPTTSYPTFVAGQIDAGMMFQPFRTLCELQKTCVVGVDLAKGEGPEDLRVLNGGFETFAARRAFIEANGVAIDAFIQAMTETIAWMQDPANFDKLMTITRKYLTLGDIANADATLVQLVRTETPKFGVKINRKSIQGFSDFLIKYKLIEQPVSAATFVYAKTP